MPETVEAVATAASRGRVVEALLRLGRAAHKSTIYPAGHPAVPGAVKHFLEALARALEDRSSLSLGVARDRILVEGEPIDGKNNVLSWLAEHMHERAIGALELAQNIPESDGVRFVEWLAMSGPGEGAGAAPGDELPVFQGIRLTRFDFALVRFGEDPAADPEVRDDPVRAWTALMSGLLGGGARDVNLEDPDAMARAVSEGIEQGRQTRASTASRLIAMSAHLSKLAEPVRDSVKKRIGIFIKGVTPELRTELLRVDPNSSRQKIEFVTEIVDALPSTAVLEVLGNIDRTGARVPHQFITLMNKLINLSAGDPTLREPMTAKIESLGLPASLMTTDARSVRGVLEEVMHSRMDRSWNPEHYQALLEDLSSRRVQGESVAYGWERYRDPRSAEELKSQVSDILLRLLVARPEAPEAPALVKALDEEAPRALAGGRYGQVHAAASAVRELAARAEVLPEEFRRNAADYLSTFTEEEPIEKILLGTLEEKGPLSEPLVGLFRISGVEGAYAAFRRLLDMEEGRDVERLRNLLVHTDPDELSAAVARLRSEGWSSLRLLFPVLQRIGGGRAVEMALTFVGNEDEKVRAEAYRILLSEDSKPGQAERYLEHALADASPRVVGLALGRARQRGGAAVTALLGGFLREDSGWSADLRIKAIGILGAFRTVDARDILIPLLTTRKIALWVNQVEVSRALEEALEAVGDPPSLSALAAWRRSPKRWVSLLLVKGTTQR